MREFLAIPLPASLRRDAAGLAEALRLPSEAWRLAREDGFHVTIRFLGEVDPARHEHLDAAWRGAARGTGRLALRISGASAAPSAARPRVIWLKVVDETPGEPLAALADRIERAARREGFEAEERRFRPHVTLARARRGERARAPEAMPAADLGAFTAERLVLFSSRLGPGGSVYEELASYPLEGDASS